MVRPEYTAVDCTLFRIADYDTPLWDRRNSQAGRYNQADHGSTQYWSKSPQTAWAERLRYLGITDLEDLAEIRSMLWVGHFRTTELADLTDRTWQRFAQVTDRDLTSDDWTACQVAGDTARDLGARGPIAPSAATADGINVVLFGRMVRGDWIEQPHGHPIQLSDDQTIPVELAAIGRPADDVLGRVTHHKH